MGYRHVTLLLLENAHAGHTSASGAPGRHGGLGTADLFPLLELLGFYPAVLEPDFDLALGEVDELRKLPAPGLGDVCGAGVLSFQLCNLELGVRSSSLPQCDCGGRYGCGGEVDGLLDICNTHKDRVLA